jgi:hypothetical protein
LPDRAPDPSLEERRTTAEMRTEDIVTAATEERVAGHEPEAVAASLRHRDPVDSTGLESALPAADFDSSRMESGTPLAEPITISGPSFLGLDSGSGSSSSDSYLDEDEPPTSHARSLVLLLVLVILAIVIYWKWQSIRDFVVPPPTTHSQQERPAQSAAPSEPGSATASSDNAAPQPGPPANPNGLPQKDTATIPDQPKPVKAEPKEAAPKEDEKPTAQPAAQPAARPAAQPAGAELVASGERYLYGRDVPRNCSQAVVNFNAAAKQNNPRALSYLGSLYATGQCVPLDRALAYQWFSRALALDRGNTYLAHNLNMLWGEMSSEERARATQKRTF